MINFRIFSDYKQKAALLICLLLIVLSLTLPQPEGLSVAGFRMFFITLIAFILWVFEVIPIQLTALIILFLQFALGVAPLTTSLNYITHPVGLLIFAGFALSAGIQECNLDKLIISKIVEHGGQNTRRLLLLLMSLVAFLSMWISNTATSAIMMPFAYAIHKSTMGLYKNIGKLYTIGIAYAATIGGIGTPIGTTTNPIVIANVKTLLGINISFLKWISIGMPFVIILIPLSWLVLIKIFPPEIDEFSDGFKNDSFHDFSIDSKVIRMIVIFITLILLWFSESFFKVPDNWIYKTSFFIALVIYLPHIGILDWKKSSKYIDMGVIIVVAGGLALGKGLLSSGALTWLLDKIIPTLQNIPLILLATILASLSGLSILLFCSITATASALVPIAIILGQNLGHNPIIFAAIAGICSTFAFLLPANTPPNAIAFSTGFFNTRDMLRAGIPILAAGIFVIIMMQTFVWPFIL